VEIEHDLRRARLAGIQRNPSDPIETRTDRRRLDLRGFFTWAQPAIPARTTPAISERNKDFFIPKKSELLANRFKKSINHCSSA
jgi:hypothetical protein